MLELTRVAKKSFECVVVTPQASVVSGKAYAASLPAWDGSMGVLPGRAPILARLGAGEMRIDFADSEKGQGGSASYYVEGGFVKMAENKLTVLAEKAVPVEQVTQADAEKQLKAAETMKVEGAGAARLASADRRTEEIAKARAKMRVAKK